MSFKLGSAKLLLALSIVAIFTGCDGGSGGGGGSSAPAYSGSSSSASTGTSASFEKFQGDNQIAITQIQNTYTIAQLTKALRTVAQILVHRDPTADELTQVSTGGFSAYQTLVQNYLNSDAFKTIQLAYYRNLFEMSGVSGGINYDEPANLATFLVFYNYDFRAVVTANYCVDNNLNIINCSAFANTTLAKAQAAGAITTRGFLQKWAGPFNFKRYNRVYKAFACKDYLANPDSKDVGMTEAEISTNVKNFRCNTPLSSSNPNGCSPLCYSCHRNLNPRASLFYAFDQKGMYNTAQNTNPSAGEVTLTDVGTASTTADLLVGAVKPRFYGDNVENLQSFATRFSQGKEFRDCLAQRLSNQMLNRSPLDPMLPTMQDIRDHVDLNGYRPKSILLEIATHPAFVLR